MHNLSKSLLATARSAARFVSLSNQYHKSAPEAIRPLHRLLKVETVSLMRRTSALYFKLLIMKKSTDKKVKTNNSRNTKNMRENRPKGGEYKDCSRNNLYHKVLPQTIK